MSPVSSRFWLTIGSATICVLMSFLQTCQGKCIPDTVLNAGINPNKPNFNADEIVTYTCDTGYTHIDTSGDLTRTCQKNDSWTGDPPVCTVVTCTAPAVPAHASVDVLEDHYNYSTMISYSCDIGFEITSGNVSRSCRENGTWSGDAPTCTIVTCTAPAVPAHASVDVLEDHYNYSTVITYSCDIGLEITSGNVSRSCRENGTWSGDAPTCTIVTCTAPAVPAQASVDVLEDHYNYSTVISYSCDIGFEITSGSVSRSCRENGTWSGDAPTCTMVTCDAPLLPINASVDVSEATLNYSTVITYTCDIGYEFTSGNTSRMCGQDGNWTGDPPMCTVISCTVASLPHATFTPNTTSSVTYLTEVTYVCDYGYNATDGDLTRVCQANKTFSGLNVTCSIVTCEPDVVQNGIITSSLSVYNYLSDVTYECDVGYNHSSGHLTRECLFDGSWSGVAPFCELIQCPPPDDIDHATYVPSVVIYDWSTLVEYACDAAYHHVAGYNKTTCNETGTFPAIDLNCSVPHSLTIDPLEPSVHWINTSITATSVAFSFDSICDVTLTSVPAFLDLSRSKTGSSLTVNVAQNAQTTDGSYVVSVEPFHDGNTWTVVSFDVFSGNYIDGLQAFLDNDISKIAAWRNHSYTVNMTQQSADVTFTVLFDSLTGTETVNIPGALTSHVFYHAFEQVGQYHIVFNATNPVSDVTSSFVDVIVIAPINNLEIQVDADVFNTDFLTDLQLLFNSTAVLPMEEIDITLDFGNGTQTLVNDSLYENRTLPHAITVPMTYDVQGYYNVTATITNVVSSLVLHKVMGAWDDIRNVTLAVINTTGISVTGETFVVEFQNVPRSGFEYLIDFTDGSSDSSSSDSVLYQSYSHQEFTHAYLSPGVYHLTWNISNKAYTTSGVIQITVENTIKDVMAWLQNPIISIEVDRAYTYEANGTEGSNVTLIWDMDDGTNQPKSILGEFTTDTITHTYTSPSEYNISLTISNLVSNETVYVQVDAFYKPNDIDFVASRTTSNISVEVDFSFIVNPSASLPMKELNYLIDYKSGPVNVSETIRMDSNYPLPSTLTHSHTFTTQGDYNVTAKIENVLGVLDYTILVRVWDGLDHLDLAFVGDNGVYITNETAYFEFDYPPNGGHTYNIDYGDGTSVDYSDEEIYYRPYNLTMFDHAYKNPGVYTLTWTAANKAYTRTETKLILVQNPVPSHSYSLEPDNKKYPWVNLQSMSIPLNITLNDTVASPTNCTCIFYPGDGTADVTDLVFTGMFFEYQHNYLTEGNFTSRLNCSNLVSSQIYEYNVTVQKFLARFVMVEYAEVVPLNRSATVVVYFHILNQGFAFIPYNVELEFDFGDGTSRRRKRATEVYDKPTFDHTYTERGNYTVTVKVDASVTNTQNTRTYSIRIGTMYYDYSDTIAFINHTLVRHTMHGVLGGNTVYTLDFDDNSPDSCNSVDYNGCHVDHYCPFYGYKNITVTASNGTFIEIDWFNLTCDNPITNGVDVPWTVSIPTGYVELKLFINESALYLPVLNVKINMGDPIRRDTHTTITEITYDKPYIFPFSYLALGRQIITVECWNLINSTFFTTKITVTNEDFLFTGSFDRKYSQEASPMYVSSMRDTEIFSRLFVSANRTLRTHVNDWTIGPDVNVAQPLNRHGLVFTIGLVEERKYLITLNTSFVEEPNNIIQEPTYVQFVTPPPHVELVGGTRRVFERGSMDIDALTLSYDLARPGQLLTFVWQCTGYTVSTFDDAESSYLSSSSGTTCDTVDNGNGTLLLNTYKNPSDTFFVVTVTATNNRSVQSSFTQIVRVLGSVKALSIRCQINCLAKVAVTSYLQLVPEVAHNCPASFSWAIYNKTGAVVGTSNVLPSLIADNLTETASSSRTLTIKPNAFSYGSSYIVTLSMIYGGVVYGPAYHEFKTNLIPKGGNCDIIPVDEQLRELPVLSTIVTYEAKAVIDQFNLTCKEWTDEGFTESTFTNTEPLFYFFFTRFTGDTYERQILYFDPGSSSNLVTFQVGDPSNDYELEVVLRIVDVFGDYEELIYTVKSVPDSSMTSNALNTVNDDEQADVVKPYLDLFTDELIKANRTWDYRTLSRKITGIASLYNNIELNGTIGKELTPEELTSLGSDGQLGWSDYWKIIVDVHVSLLSNSLIKIGEEYVSYLYESIVTWPAERRLPLATIQTLSRAVSATLDKKEYSNVTAAIMASKIADTLAFNLANNVEDRTFPITWTLMSAVNGVKVLCRNILAELQTVLTPNLPQDPTADEMRNFLEYINVFKSDDETAQGLSLQEQTFLAQKQLQRYFLDNYIKSRASKEALPYLTFALRNLTNVLTKLTDIGQPAIIIENDFFFLSAEIVPANLLIGATVTRPGVGIEVNLLTSYDPGQCGALEIPIKTTVFKENPYFWGEFGDRITSYVPVFEFGDAKLGGENVVYRLRNKVTPECVDETPTYDKGDTNKMIYILFNRQFAGDDILLFIRPNTTELIYDVYLNTLEKPNIDENKYEYTTRMQRDANYTLEDGHKLLIKSSKFGGTGKIWIGLKPILENSDDQDLILKQFCANVTSVSCLSWVADGAGEYYWNKDVCEVSTASTKIDTICECKNTNTTMTVGTTFLVPPNKIDFDRRVRYSEPVGRSPFIGLFMAVIVTYILLLVWTWREDAKDQYKWSYSLLIDNDIADQYFYILQVFTGMRSGSGTLSKIAFILAGESSDTGIRMLDDQAHIGFETGSVRTFVMSTRRQLGDLMSIRIWHDDTGVNESSWFLNKITVKDLQSFHRYSFVCEDWLDFDIGDKKIERVLSGEKSTSVWSIQDMVSYTIAEHHIWISVFFRPFRSDFTRIQRLSCLYGQIFITMILTSIFMKSDTLGEIETSVHVVFLRLSIENLEASIAAVTLGTILIAIVCFLFRFSRKNGRNNVDSPIRKFYRKLNDRMQLDTSVLKTAYDPPAEKAVYHSFNFLPGVLSNVGWVSLVIIVMLTTAMMFLMSDGWKVEVSKEWVTTVICGYIISILIIEVLKIILIVLLYSLCCPRAYEPTEPFIDIETLKEITKYNSASLTINPEFSNDLKPAEVPDQATLLEHKRERMRNHQLLKMFSQLALYSGVLYLVYTISFESRDFRSYELKSHIEELFLFKEKVTDLQSYTSWLNGRFIQSYFSSSFYGQESNRTEATIRPFANDLANYRVGPARLRQLRTRPERCQGPLGDGRICYNAYEDQHSARLDYCIGWTPTPCAVSEKSSFFSNPAWEYTPASEVWGLITIAEYTSYAGGGYFMKLDVNDDVCQKIFNELLEYNWFDRATRAVILEFTMYNANTNLFVYSKFVAEFPEIGGVITFTDIHVFRLFNDVGTSGDFVELLKFIFFILVIVAFIKMVFDVCKEGCKFFKSAWNLLDVLGLTMSIVTISMYLFKLTIINKTTALFQADRNAYVGFENLAFYDFLVNTTHGILVFLLSIRVSRILGYSGKINEMAAVISHAAEDLKAFLIIFGITFFAYVALGTLLFGALDEKYKDLFHTYGTITEAIVGKNKLQKILVSKPWYAEFYFFTFVLFVMFTLTTMVEAILNFSINLIKEEQKKLMPNNIIEVILDRFSTAVAFFKRKTGIGKGTNSSNQATSAQDNPVNVNDILMDFHMFIRKVNTDKKYLLGGNDTPRKRKTDFKYKRFPYYRKSPEEGVENI